MTTSARFAGLLEECKIKNCLSHVSEVRSCEVVPRFRVPRFLILGLANSAEIRVGRNSEDGPRFHAQRHGKGPVSSVVSADPALVIGSLGDRRRCFAGYYNPRRIRITSGFLEKFVDKTSDFHTLRGEGAALTECNRAAEPIPLFLNLERKKIRLSTKPMKLPVISGPLRWERPGRRSTIPSERFSHPSNQELYNNEEEVKVAISWVTTGR